jgi:hypothetical protein
MIVQRKITMFFRATIVWIINIIGIKYTFRLFATTFTSSTNSVTMSISWEEKKIINL